MAGLVADAAAGRLDAQQASQVRTANDRRDDARLGIRTLYRWAAAHDQMGLLALAPRRTAEPAAPPPWLTDFLVHHRLPSKPTASEALRNYLATLGPGDFRPNLKQVLRALKRLPLFERLKGREGRLALKARQAYRLRDFSGLSPTTVYAADGKTFDAEVAHPIHGRPFRPEITTIIDVATRRVVGWSVALDESYSAVADALRTACSKAGIPAMFYTDRGSGYVNKAMDAPLTGLLTRLNITAMRALPYNSQAKGVVERLNQVYTASARALPTYIGREMDREARLLAFKVTRRELALTGTSTLLIGWNGFIDHINRTLTAYNNRPHSSLPKVFDPQTGRMRHMTPSELWDEKSRGVELFFPDADELDDLARPYVVRKTRRALVSWQENSYFALELEAFDGQDVIVAYDIHDASRVWVRAIEMHDDERVPGRLICVAVFEGHKTRYVPLSAERAAMEKRVKGRKARLDKKISVVAEELRPLLEAAPLSAAMPHPAIALPRAPEPVPAAQPNPAPVREDGMPVFRDDVSFARWCAENPEKMGAVQRDYLRDLLTTPSTKELLRLSAVDLEALGKILRSAA